MTSVLDDLDNMESIIRNSDMDEGDKEYCLKTLNTAYLHIHGAMYGSL